LLLPDLPKFTSTSLLNSSSNRFDLPNVHFDDYVNDIAMRHHAYQRGIMVYDAVGATRIIRVPPSVSAPNLGTCRQTARREDGVCNKWGQNARLQISKINFVALMGAN
jgi:hypothetical protein